MSLSKIRNYREFFWSKTTAVSQQLLDIIKTTSSLLYLNKDTRSFTLSDAYDGINQQRLRPTYKIDYIRILQVYISHSKTSERDQKTIPYLGIAHLMLSTAVQHKNVYQTIKKYPFYCRWEK
ncbi:hypothetical protein ACFSTE_09825 [Aquimarina hainanensis]|uniref:Uncharacterized protein n=1 Tax=Aquimarina hainanensis TaxID=1578017 RepID=A0ABW5NAB1_9FLAO|nr:hypothetical protein [Aquimarina sp. TRL1]QKX05628.1 hypothetical protein HN014_12105 [Aquimarina sp. TRL1]